MESDSIDPFEDYRGLFIKGPASLPWLVLASSGKGRTLQLALVLFFLSGMAKSKTVVVQSRFLEAFQITRQSYYRALNNLEGIGLVKVRRRRGRRAVVTLLRSEVDHG